MKLTMKEILEKYENCDMFSLTGFARGYKISKEEFFNALDNVKEKNRHSLKEMFDIYKLKQNGYPEFDKLYLEIEKECKQLNSDEKQKLHYLSDQVGKTTKYGKDHKDFFWFFYHSFDASLEREKDEIRYCTSTGKNPIEQIPQELKEYLLYYKVSFYNVVTESVDLMINYYFPLNDKTKEYLLKFETDFYLNQLEDLAFYKNNNVEFYSCTHENFNTFGQY